MKQLPKSTEPIVKVEGLRNHKIDSDSESSDEEDSDQFYFEFGSSDEDKRDVESVTTKTTGG